MLDEEKESFAKLFSDRVKDDPEKYYGVILDKVVDYQDSKKTESEIDSKLFELILALKKQDVIAPNYLFHLFIATLESKDFKPEQPEELFNRLVRDFEESKKISGQDAKELLGYNNQVVLEDKIKSAYVDYIRLLERGNINLTSYDFMKEHVKRVYEHGVSGPRDQNTSVSTTPGRDGNTVSVTVSPERDPGRAPIPESAQRLSEYAKGILASLQKERGGR
jgi:hypothetical protein